MQSNDTRSEAQPLPTPTIDMEGEDAAHFIEQIAELYAGVDRWHVRRLAAHLRTPPPEPEPEDKDPTVRSELKSLAHEVRSAQCDAESAASRLEDAADRLEDALAKLTPKVVRS